MAKFLYAHYSFSNGELNPRLLGRTDIKEYFSAGKELTNFAISPKGGINQLRGSVWLSTDTDEFQDPSEAYDFTFQETYAVKIHGRTVTDSISLFKTPNISGSNSLVNLEEVTLTLSAGIQAISLLGFEYATHVSLNNVVIITDKLGSEPIVMSKIIGEGSEEWKAQTWTEYAIDVGALADSDIQREWKSRPMSGYILSRTETLTLSGTTLTSNNFNIADAFGTIEGSFITLSDGATDYVVQIDSVTNSTTVEVSDVEGSAPDGDYELYRIPIWYGNKWPKIVNYFQGRLLFANGEYGPDTIWNSVAGNLVSFAVPLRQDTETEADAFFIQPDTNEATPISWLVVERYLTAGTHTAEYVITGIDGVYSSSSSDVSEVSRYGSSKEVGLAFRAQASTYFVESDETTIREMSYSEENGGYTSRNIGLLGPEIDQIQKIVYDYRTRRLYIQSTSDIYLLTIDPASGISGWSRIEGEYKISGVLSFESTTVGGKPEKMLLCKKAELSQDQKSIGLLFYTENEVYQGEVDSDTFPIGEWMTLVSTFSPDGDDYPLLDDNYQVFFTGDPDLDNVYYFNNDTLEWVETELNVASGHSSFPDGTLYITVSGYAPSIICKKPANTATVETTPIQQGSAIGDAQVGKVRVDQVGLRLYKTRQGFKAGTTETGLETVTLSGEYTGQKIINPSGCPENDHSVILKNESIWPIALLSISTRGMEQEG